MAGKRMTLAFSKNISVKSNPNNLVQGLNSTERVHILKTIIVTSSLLPSVSTENMIIYPSEYLYIIMIFMCC